MNPFKKSSQKKRILDKRVDLRKQLWPEVKDDDLWTHKRKDGFVPIPRVMPLVLQIMDDLCGKRVSPAYMDLWCRKFDEQFITLSKSPRHYAFFSGFAGERREQAWTDRIRKLSDLGFIKTKRGADGEFTYALVLDPLKVIQRHVEKRTPGLREDYITALLDRSNEVRAKDLQASVVPVVSLRIIKKAARTAKL